MLVQEPVHAAIWHCLNHYDYGDATFLAERLFHEIGSDQSLHLLATCYFRAGRLGQAYDVLQAHGANTPQARFLFAKVCALLNKLSEAEATIVGDLRTPFGQDNAITDAFKTKFGDSTSFALQLLSTIYASTERESKANDADKASLELNPFLFKSFEALCNRGPDHPSPYKVFNAETLSNLNYSVGINPVLNYANHGESGANPPAAFIPGSGAAMHHPPTTSPVLRPPQLQPPSAQSSNSATSTPIVPPPQLQQQLAGPVAPPHMLLMTPVAATPSGADHLDSSYYTCTPAEGSSACQQQSAMSGVNTLNYTTDTEAAVKAGGGVSAPGTPLATPSPCPGGRVAMPPPMIKPSRARQRAFIPATKTPLPTAKKLSYFSPCGANVSGGNASFGHLPAGVLNFGHGSDVTLPSPVAPGIFSSLMVLSPCGGGGNSSVSNNENSGLSNISNSSENQKGSKRSLGESNTLKSNANIISGQNTAGTPSSVGVVNVGGVGGASLGGNNSGSNSITGNTGLSSGNVVSGNNTTVRRSSRLFGSTQNTKSSKENSGNKPVTPSNAKRSKAKNKFGGSSGSGGGGGGAKDVGSSLAEKNERNKEASSGAADSAKDTIPAITIQEAAAAATTAAAAAFSTPPHLHHEVSAKMLSEQALVIQKSSVSGLMDLLRLLGAAYSELTRYNSRRAITLLLDEIPAHHKTSGWVLGLLGKAHCELGLYKEAKKCFKDMRDKDPHRLERTEIYSTVLWHLSEEVELSCLAQDLTRIDKLSPQAWCATGNCFSLQKEHENAIKFFKRAIQVDPNFSYAYTLLGHEYVMIEELDKALQCFRSAVRTDRRHYNAWYGIGLTYYKQERYKLTEMYYNKALAINPHNPILMCHLAVVQHNLQKSDRALDTLNTALQMDPKNAMCKFERASILNAIERWPEALKELNDLKELVPKESPVYFLMGKVHSKMGNTHLALMHFSWAMDLDPKGANSQIKDALDPTLNRANQDDLSALSAPAEPVAVIEAAVDASQADMVHEVTNDAVEEDDGMGDEEEEEEDEEEEEEEGERPEEERSQYQPIVFPGGGTPWRPDQPREEGPAPGSGQHQPMDQSGGSLDQSL